MTFDRNLLPNPSDYYESEGLHLSGPSGATWKTTECKFHGGSDSMRVNVKTGSFRCMNCGARGGDVLAYQVAAYGQEFIQAAKSLGAWVDDGRPQKLQKLTTLSPRASLEVLGFESTVVAMIASNMARKEYLTDEDRDRLLICTCRINRIVEEFAQ